MAKAKYDMFSDADSDETLYAFLEILVYNQTSQERDVNEAIELNGVGFSKATVHTGMRLYRFYNQGDIGEYGIQNHFFYPTQRVKLIKILNTHQNQF